MRDDETQNAEVNIEPEPSQAEVEITPEAEESGTAEEVDTETPD